VATTLIRAALGGTAPDDDGRLRLLVPADALAVDTTVTIVADAAASPGARRLLGAWRLVAHPAPAVLAVSATLSASVPPGERAQDLRLLVGDGDGANGWQPLSTTILGTGDQSVDAETWYVPPSHGPPPVRSSVLICLCGPARPPATRG
jgi:hypothetical protein